MSIQDSINQINASIAGVAIGAKHLKNQEDANKLAGIQQAENLSNDYNASLKQQDKAIEKGLDLEEQNKTVDAEYKQANDELAALEEKYGIAKPTPEQKLMSAITGEPTEIPAPNLNFGQQSALTRAQKRQEAAFNAKSNLADEIKANKEQQDQINLHMNTIKQQAQSRYVIGNLGGTTLGMHLKEDKKDKKEAKK